MSWWKSTKRQRGWVKAHEAKAIGHYARKAEDKRTINEALDELVRETERLGLYEAEDKRLGLHEEND